MKMNLAADRELMTGKNTKAKRMIQKLGLLYGVNYDDKTYKNIKKIMVCYREYRFGQDIFDFSIMSTMTMDEVLPNLYKSFIMADEISDKVVNTMVVQLINDKIARSILEKAKEDIYRFGEVGENYIYILEKLFFTEAFPSNTDIYLDMDLSSTQYSYRKEEAIMIFGICFWQECLKQWDNCDIIMQNIKMEMGRYDLIDARIYDMGYTSVG